MAVTVNIDSQIVVKTAAQWAADSTVYSSQRILVTSDVTYTNSDQRKFKIADGVQTWSNLDYMPIAQTLAQVLANDNDTNNLDIVSPNGKSIVAVHNQYIRLLHDDGNDSELYLHSADATLKTATGGFYVNETALTDTKFVQIKSASTTIQHDTTVSVNTPNVNLPQETASRIAIFDASKNVKAANTTTYPSLTELSYVKGVTSAIQTQLNTKVTLDDVYFTLPFYSGVLSPADATTYYFSPASISPSTTATNQDFSVGYNFTVIGAMILCSANTTSGTAENSTLYVRNTTTSTSSTMGTFQTNGSTTVVISTTLTGLSINVDATDSFCLEWLTPTWVTNPVAFTTRVILMCKRR
jgi:hypothetical protein